VSVTLALLTPLFLGLLAGAGHVVSGPDHLAAVAPLSLAHRRHAWWRGICWGIGHAAGVWLLAGLALAVRASVSIESISGWSERFVGIVLIAIGLFGLRRALSTRVHAHEHEHDGVRHTHFHIHPAESAHPPDAPLDAPTANTAAPATLADHHHHHDHQALGIGALHGFAGTSHLLGVLPAFAMGDNSRAIAYLLGFGIGATVCMAAFAAVMGELARHAARWGVGAYRGLVLASCGLAVIIGGWWIFAAA
jgi:ABC-type nickel/cobalt efflux system permease component RcnA